MSFEAGTTTLETSMRYQGFFINLAESVSRRENVERQLAQLQLGHRDRRFEAIRGDRAAEQPQTTLSPGQLGCWLSHLALWRAAGQSTGHLHILEDDVRLTPLLIQILDQLELDESSWDLLFTDVYFHPPPTPEQFIQLCQAREAFLKKRKIALIDLRRLSFTGTTSYLVNRRSLVRLESLLAEGWRQNQTIDVAIQSLVRRGELRARLVFPFLSTLSPEHELSTAGMQGPATRALDTFRQAWFYEADLAALRQRLGACRCQPETGPLLELYLHVLRQVLGTVHSDANRPG
ncbi:MAG: glycosyltransferase family 25 protein [Planctomycetota bacterium]